MGVRQRVEKFFVLIFLLPLAVRFSKSAIQHCRLNSLDLFNRKTCQISWVASLVFSVGRW
ncbi:hypothetical protein EJ063_20015 [Vibrio aquaticus]|uniref:Uncharacterized protein n=1 Tax=Vibrio aquaticus TaxID=2496559 RepID=A0A432CRR4_9VIBR|nr:hypothetical protein EJ063_20015 [Vibrio aquaticus]